MMMQNIKVWSLRLLWLVLIILLLMFLTVFIQQNATLISLKLFNWSTQPELFSNWLIITFVLGGVCGLLAAVGVILKLKLSNASLTRKVRRRDTELKTVRTNALKGLAE